MTLPPLCRPLWASVRARSIRRKPDASRIAYDKPKAMVAFEPTAAKMATTAEQVKIVRDAFEPLGGVDVERDLSGLAGGDSGIESEDTPNRSLRRKKYITSGRSPCQSTLSQDPPPTRWPYLSVSLSSL